MRYLASLLLLAVTFLASCSCSYEHSTRLSYGDSKMPKVCFSPDEHCDVPLVAFLAGAKKSLDLAIYDINRPELVSNRSSRSRRRSPFELSSIDGNRLARTRR
jgi:hypothetical protein